MLGARSSHSDVQTREAKAIHQEAVQPVFGEKRWRLFGVLSLPTDAAPFSLAASLLKKWYQYLILVCHLSSTSCRP